MCQQSPIVLLLDSDAKLDVTPSPYGEALPLYRMEKLLEVTSQLMRLGSSRTVADLGIHGRGGSTHLQPLKPLLHLFHVDKN
jgi:hypothetical protein